MTGESATAATELRSLYEAEYRRQFSKEIPGGEVEILSWGLTVTAELASHIQSDLQPRTAVPLYPGATAEPTGTAEVWDVATAAVISVPLYPRAGLPAGGGVSVIGPAIIFEENTSTFVNASFNCEALPDGTLQLNRTSPPRAAAPAQTAVVSGGGAPMSFGSYTAATDDSNEEKMTMIQYQTMWARLQAVVEEQATALLRTAMSVIVREGGDLSCGIFDLQGRMMAQAVTGTPGHVNSMAESVLHFMQAFPADTMKPGDVYTTNDPWKATGHVSDK